MAEDLLDKQNYFFRAIHGWGFQVWHLWVIALLLFVLIGRTPGVRKRLPKWRLLQPIKLPTDKDARRKAKLKIFTAAITLAAGLSTYGIYTDIQWQQFKKEGRACVFEVIGQEKMAPLGGANSNTLTQAVEQYVKSLRYYPAAEELKKKIEAKCSKYVFVDLVMFTDGPNMGVYYHDD